MVSPRVGILLFSLSLSGILISDAGGQGTASPYTWAYDTIPFGEGQLVGGGNWSCLWLGYGSGYESNYKLWLKPRVSTGPSETHSALVRSQFRLGPNWDVSVMITTTSQLRMKKVRGKLAPAPHPWEVAWLLANMTEDGRAGLYFTLKTNGVELGAYRETGEQYFLYTGTSTKNTIGVSYPCQLIRNGSQITAFVSGKQVATASLDVLGSWPLGDRVGLYTEDAAVNFGPVTVITGP